jgi:hypothetical protein
MVRYKKRKIKIPFSVGDTKVLKDLMSETRLLYGCPIYDKATDLCTFAIGLHKLQ